MKSLFDPLRALVVAGTFALLAPSYALTVTSPAFSNGGEMADQFTYTLANQCSGNNISPPLEISDVPAGTVSLAVTVIDPNGGDWLHWLAYNIPSYTRSLPAGASSTGTFPEAMNHFGTGGYGGACPPNSTGTHNYQFTVYALNATFDSDPTVAQLTSAAIATATITATRSYTSSRNWSPAAITPTDGLWVVDAERGASGRGFQILTSNGVLVFTFYGWGASGNSEWYLSAGSLANSTYTGTLDRYTGGMSMGGQHRAAALAGNDGSVSITFTGKNVGTITFPGESPKAISRFTW